MACTTLVISISLRAWPLSLSACLSAGLNSPASNSVAPLRLPKLGRLMAAGGADGSQQFARVAVEHQGRRHGRAWAFARLYAVGYRLAVFCGDEREVGHLVVE